MKIVGIIDPHGDRVRARVNPFHPAQLLGRTRALSHNSVDNKILSVFVCFAAVVVNSISLAKCDATVWSPLFYTTTFGLLVVALADRVAPTNAGRRVFGELET